MRGLILGGIIGTVSETNATFCSHSRVLALLPFSLSAVLDALKSGYNKVKVTVGVDNIFNYVPKTLGSGITMFNVPATAGAKAHVQVEVLVDELVKAFRKKK